MSGRRVLLVAACALLGAGAGFATGAFAPALYRAQAQLIVDASDARASHAETTEAEKTEAKTTEAKTTDVEAAAGTPARDGDALATQVENQVRVLTSESVLRRLIAEKRLDEDPDFDGSPASDPAVQVTNALLEAVGAGEPKAASPTRAAMRILRHSVVAHREPRSTVVTVSVAARDPHKAMVLADSLVAAYVAETADAREAASAKAAAAFESRIADARRALEQAERRAEGETRRDGVGTRRKAGEWQLASATERLDRARAASAKAATDHRQALDAQRASEPDFVPEPLRSAVLGERRAQLAEVLRRLADITATRGPRHPDVIEVKAREAAIRRPLAEEIARIALAARRALETARADERRAAKTLDDLKASTNAGTETAPHMREREREVSAARSLYEAMLARSREAAGGERAGTADIRVISNAALPERRVWPPPTPILVLAGLASGLVLGLALAVPLGRRAVKRPLPPGRALVRD